MFRVGKCVAALALVAAAWAGLSLTAQEPKPGAGAKGAKPVDLAALRDAVDTAAKRGENVDEIRTALNAFEKALPNAKAGAVPPELQALRDAVDAAARKGENVEAITKELVAVEMAVAGKSLAKPRPEPPQPNPPFPNPNPVPFPNVPFPGVAPGGLPGGIDVEMFNKAMELRKKALEMMIEGRGKPETQKEAQKLLTEANELMLKAARNGGGVAPIMPVFPDVGRIPDRARLGVRIERVPAVAADQLGLEANMGIAVTMVTPGSAAEKAGLKVHDIILEFAGKAVNDNTEDFIRRVNEVKTGEKVDLVVLRKGKKVEVKGVELPEAAKRPALPPFPQPALPLPGLLPDQPNLPLIKPLPLPVPIEK